MNPITLTLGAVLFVGPGDGCQTDPVATVGNELYIVPANGRLCVPVATFPVHVSMNYRDGLTPDAAADFACQADFDADGDCGTDADIEAFFAGWPIDYDQDGEAGTDLDILAFFAAFS